MEVQEFKGISWSKGGTWVGNPKKRFNNNLKKRKGKLLM